MRVRVLAPLVGILLVLAAMAGYGSDDGTPGDDEPPSFFFDWSEVTAADAPPVATLAPGPNGTCTGHVQTFIALGPDESGVKSLTLASVPGEPCTFEVHATARADDGTTYRSDVDAAMDADCCTYEARNVSDVTAHGDSDSDNGEDIWVNTYCRLADGWAHTGYPDPPTVVYTRVYHEMKFCYDGVDAWITSFQGLCFANQGAGWYTDPEECYWYDADVGPADPVFLALHGYFQKSQSDPFAPNHELWNTLHGKPNGGVYCTGDIEGDYDGYASTNNCGATAPDPQL